MLKCFVNRIWRERYLGFIFLLFDAVTSSAGVIICRDGFRGGKSCGFRKPGCSSWRCSSTSGRYRVSRPRFAGHGHTRWASWVRSVKAPGERGCCAAPIAQKRGSCWWAFHSRKREDLTVLTERPPWKPRFARGGVVVGVGFSPVCPDLPGNLG